MGLTPINGETGGKPFMILQMRFDNFPWVNYEKFFNQCKIL